MGLAWQLLALSYAFRAVLDQPAVGFFTPEEVNLLHRVITRSGHSAADAVLALGTWVGFAPPNRQPWPGVNVLAKAIEQFYFVKLGSIAS